ncbi:DUF1990 family protein [Crossiella sp. CA198]|uniref:DUF1990 family protein n=1 Tax=Crossiella sp. CA198 TaxID=3455607 RepID=UPI003F8CF85B
MSGRLARIRDRAAQAEVTYAEVGVTRETECPPGYRRVSRTLRLGHGDAEFARARLALRDWATHRGFGRGIYLGEAGQGAAGQEVGDTVVSVLGFGPLSVVGPCRVVWRVDEARRYGFGYGTLPGHPVTGEESFVLVQGSDGAVQFTITAVSRPGGQLARWTGPIGRLAQRVAMAAYLHALR